MIPHPNKVYEDLVALVELFHRDYEEAYGYSHDYRDRKSEDHATDAKGQRVRIGRITGTRFSDPTGAIGIDGHRRRQLHRVGKSLYGFTTKSGKKVPGVIARIIEARGVVDRIITPPPEEWDRLEPITGAGSIKDEDRPKTPELRNGQRHQRKRQLFREVERLEEVLTMKQAELKRLS